MKSKYQKKDQKNSKCPLTCSQFLLPVCFCFVHSWQWSISVSNISPIDWWSQAV